MNTEIRSLDCDSRRVQENSLFFAIEGYTTDGHRYIDQALRNGAVGVASEREAPAAFPQAWIRVGGIRDYMAWAADEFYGQPSRRLSLIGITGTNGKTTTGYLAHSILQVDSPALLMGTVERIIGKAVADSVRTTPEAPEVQFTLKQALDEGCRVGVIEVSSHALSLRRVYKCRFPVGVFTNLSQDHLDFHGTMESYFQAKRLLFQTEYNPGIRSAVVNADDPHSSRLQPSPRVQVFRFGLSPSNDVHPIAHTTSVEGTRMELSFFGRRLSLSTSLVGAHNLYNTMAAAAACALLGVGDEQIAEGVSRLAKVPGRFEKVDLAAPFTVVVDYAHTPKALENILKLSRRLCRGRIICVFGCGGDRDPFKRPLMGEVGASLADIAILTSDNPRSEAPQRIIEEMKAGIPEGHSNYEILPQRREAIARSLQLARPGDLVLLAGKGHETYQEINGRKVHFDDREVAREVY
ncbi:MAG: UDP-N-acetylmuramoyl-L-alanyl-D-glutamate--2,6-diaminopimelate ligase [Acidobacteriota bacterium]